MSRAGRRLQLALSTCVCLAGLAAPADAQTGVSFLSRVDYLFGLEYLATHDPRFDWDATFGGKLDLIDYTHGRVLFEAEYLTVLGNEFQPFDPNQGNYTLAGFVSARTGPVELGVVYHHVSRHLGDRAKTDPVDWNMLGARLQGAIRRGATELAMRADVRGAVLHTNVDYIWEVDAETRAQGALTGRTAVIIVSRVRVVGVDGTRDRGTQYGMRGEGGVRIDGAAAALELFVAVERRIDPYPLAFGTRSWAIAGFRVVNRQ